MLASDAVKNGGLCTTTGSVSGECLPYQSFMFCVALGVGPDVPTGGRFALPYRWSALGVGFGSSDVSAISSYHIVGSRLVLVFFGRPNFAADSPYRVVGSS